MGCARAPHAGAVEGRRDTPAHQAPERVRGLCGDQAGLRRVARALRAPGCGLRQNPASGNRLNAGFVRLLPGTHTHARTQALQHAPLRARCNPHATRDALAPCAAALSGALLMLRCHSPARSA